MCFYRNTKLWICMEYCGGGSLQDIYQGILNQITELFKWSSFYYSENQVKILLNIDLNRINISELIEFLELWRLWCIIVLI